MQKAGLATGEISPIIRFAKYLVLAKCLCHGDFVCSSLIGPDSISQ